MSSCDIAKKYTCTDVADCNTKRNKYRGKLRDHKALGTINGSNKCIMDKYAEQQKKYEEAAKKGEEAPKETEEETEEEKEKREMEETYTKLGLKLPGETAEACKNRLGEEFWKTCTTAGGKRRRRRKSRSKSRKSRRKSRKTKRKRRKSRKTKKRRRRRR
jgi:hypothetical protein